MESKPDEEEDEMLAALRKSPDGLRYNELWKAVGGEEKVPKGTFNRRLQALMARGKADENLQTKRYHCVKSLDEIAEAVRNQQKNE